MSSTRVCKAVLPPEAAVRLLIEVVTKADVMEQSKKLQNAHDKFFRFALSHLSIARGLLDMQLPAEMRSAIDLDTLKIEAGSYIDADLSEKYSDLLFSAQLHPSEHLKGYGDDCLIAKQSLIYILFEHKSDVDSLTVLQLLSYIVRIWEQRVRDGLPLCPIIPLVVYHGDRKWTAAQRIEDLVEAHPLTSDFQVRFGFPLLDLSQMPDDRVSGDPLLQCTLRLLKYSRSVQLVSKLRQIIELVAASTEVVLKEFWIQAIGVYVMAVNKNIEPEEIDYIVCDVFPTLIEPGSAAHKLLIRGREEGSEEGREEGREVGREEGREQGWLAGKIQTLQEWLGERISTNEELRAANMERLKNVVAELESRLRKRDE